MRTQERGTQQYAALVAAYEHTKPACADDPRYIQDREDVDTTEQKDMTRICRTQCPLFDLCDAYATAAKPNGGMWAGRYCGRKERTTA